MTTLSRIRDAFPLEIEPEDRLSYVLIGLWALTMIALPIAVWTVGEAAIPTGITIAAIVQATAVLYTVQVQWGWRRALRALAADHESLSWRDQRLFSVRPWALRS